jgi:hypothetical protein
MTPKRKRAPLTKAQVVAHRLDVMRAEARGFLIGFIFAAALYTVMIGFAIWMGQPS